MRPTIEFVGTVAELTQQLGFGPGSDAQFPILAERLPKLNDIITEGVS